MGTKMAADDNASKGRAVPSGRLSRLARFGSIATGVAGGMIAGGARELARGNRPTLGNLLLTPSNALRVTEQLAHLRGAAMKLGQLVSMDAGEMLPPELTDILARLRADAQPMPDRQLNAVLTAHWGREWRSRFETFTTRPIAAASIGQVHRARTRDGRDLAIKIQYPGVRTSINSDVNNVATLLRLSNLLPPTIDITALLGEAKRQLHEEADYTREGAYLARFGALLADDAGYRVPAFHADLSGTDVLAMDHVEGVPVESLIDAPQAERDRVVTLLIDLTLRELFVFGLMQTDPNFANYRYDRAGNRVVLLDFGATRTLPQDVADNYARLIRAGLAGDIAATRAAAIAIGFFSEETARTHDAALTRILEMAVSMLTRDGPFDFARTDMAAALRVEGRSIAQDRATWQLPPIDTLFLQRKIGGVALLASRLKAQVDVRGLIERYLPVA